MRWRNLDQFYKTLVIIPENWLESYRSWLLSKIFLKYGNVVKGRKLVKRGSDGVTLSQIK